MRSIHTNILAAAIVLLSAAPAFGADLYEIRRTAFEVSYIAEALADVARDEQYGYGRQVNDPYDRHYGSGQNDLAYLARDAQTLASYADQLGRVAENELRNGRGGRTIGGRDVIIINDHGGSRPTPVPSRVTATYSRVKRALDTLLNTFYRSRYGWSYTIERKVHHLQDEAAQLDAAIYGYGNRRY